MKVYANYVKFWKGNAMPPAVIILCFMTQARRIVSYNNEKCEPY